MADPTKKAGVLRVETALWNAGLDNRIVALTETARSAEEAASALGVKVAQIVKSLVFRVAETEDFILIVASGVNRVDEAKVAALLGAAPERPDARSVKERTGYSIGGVPPVGHAEKLRTFVDEDLFRHDEVWAAAGHTHAVFPCTPDELVRMTGGEVVRVRADP
ncbi:YbaK/EbsC family protein [Rubrobacter indicoceani]|uniref:YbaK/EbsC family protein n=1 Tax=Rubrobacter indicoceani TaxID=2051957 RepID=UPI000E5ADB68|nr:YbaK/EbsC family protein [Rubrobacter indicoceani]